MILSEPGGHCRGLCGWGRSKRGMDCEAGGGSCFHAIMIEAEVSEFHDASLQNATSQMQAILSAIPPDAEGRSLSFVHTQMGTILAWVSHGSGFGPDPVTYEDDDAAVIAALGLTPPDPPTAAY